MDYTINPLSGIILLCISSDDFILVKGRELALNGLILCQFLHLLPPNASNTILFVLKNMTYYKMTMTVESV
jgi:hypothetical protein